MIKDAKIIGIWGGRGSGKSTRAKSMTRDCRRVIVVDPLADWGGRGSGFVTVDSLPKLYKHLRDNWGRGFRVVYLIGQGNPVAELAALSKALFVIQRPYKDGKDARKITLVVDEMSISVPNRQLIGDERQFLNLCNLGRHWGVEIIGISQRMAQVHMDFRGNTSEDYYFRLGDAVDSGRALQRIGREHKAALASLKTHEYLFFASGQGVIKGKNNLK